MSPAPKKPAQTQSIISNYNGPEHLFTLDSTSINTSTVHNGKKYSDSVYKSQRSTNSTKSTMRTRRGSLNNDGFNKQKKARKKSKNGEIRSRANSTVPPIGQYL